ncbi:MAG: lrgB-like family protein [Enterovirga sp.]|nr:lrgB-like family protein [Enterovirga sp.]
MTRPVDFLDLWVYLSGEPLLWLAVTVSAYAVADRMAAASGRNPFVNPVVIAVALIAAILVATGTNYRTYFEGAQFVHFLLGPATVALAVPLVRNIGAVARMLVPMALALAAGSVTAVASAVVIAASLGAPPAVLATIAPKSVTTAVAMAISRELGGEPSLTAVAVIATGVFGAVIVTPFFDALGIRSREARGFAVGLAAHGIGTARAFQVSETAGLFAGLAMALNAVATALIVPAVLRLVSP